MTQDEYFEGEIGPTVVWNRQLISDEISALYKMESPFSREWVLFYKPYSWRGLWLHLIDVLKQRPGVLVSLGDSSPN